MKKHSYLRLFLSFILFVLGYIPANAQQVINGDWNTQANDYKSYLNHQFTFHFPPGGTISSRLWGTDIYTYDCSIASAAVHAGLISTQSGGTVTIEIRPGLSAYKGSTRNGVTSNNWGTFDGSFIFIKAIKHIETLSAAIPGNWNTDAVNYKGNNGKRYTYYFPPGGTVSGKLWGTDVYTSDCSIASAAVHAGLISVQNGGTVTIEIRPGQLSYRGTARNGVSSKDWGAYDGSFIFVSGNTETDPIKPASNAITATWTTEASSYKANIGQRYTFYFPAWGTLSDRIWGTDVYTHDCSIATAAVHAGLISTQSGGTVTIEIRPGRSSYTGSTRNGVTSKDWGAFDGSFIFIRN